MTVHTCIYARIHLCIPTYYVRTYIHRTYIRYQTMGTIIGAPQAPTQTGTLPAPFGQLLMSKRMLQKSERRKGSGEKGTMHGSFLGGRKCRFCCTSLIVRTDCFYCALYFCCYANFWRQACAFGPQRVRSGYIMCYFFLS